MARGGPPEQGASILEQLAHLPEFHDRRELVLRRPARARDKLRGYAAIDLKIAKAADLPPADWNQLADPFVVVCVDDCVKGQTDTVTMNLNPVWNFEQRIRVKNPASVLLLRVMDWDLGKEPDFIGFVEIPIIDLPLDVCTKGWFSLSPAGALKRNASWRFEHLGEQRPDQAHGAVYLEVTRTIVSGDSSDELYAWCLPPPARFEYPEDGWDTDRALDMQLLVDNIMEFKANLLGGFVRPALRAAGFVLSWQDVPISVLVLAACLGTSLRPYYFLTGLFGTIGVLLLLLADPARHGALLAHPASVPLDGEGYRLIAAMSDTDKMVLFLKRVLATLQAEVTDEDRFREFAAFASLEGAPATTYGGLKAQLLQVGDSPPEGSQPFISFSRCPLSKGTLVKNRQGHFGEIVECVNPDQVLSWKYKVRFCRRKEDPVVKEVPASSLEVRMDTKWLSSVVLLGVIPESLEGCLKGWADTFQRWNGSLQYLSQYIRDIACWKDKVTSLYIALGCLTLGLAFVWLQRLFFLAAFPLLFARSSEQWEAYFAWREALAKEEKQQQKPQNLRHWWFFHEASDHTDDQQPSWLFQAPTLRRRTSGDGGAADAASGAQAVATPATPGDGTPASPMDKIQNTLLTWGCMKRPVATQDDDRDVFPTPEQHAKVTTPIKPVVEKVD